MSFLTPPSSDLEDESDNEIYDKDRGSYEFPMEEEEDDDKYYSYQYDDYMYLDDQELDKNLKMLGECAQPNKVAPADATAIKLGNQDSANTKFIWKIENFRSLMDKEKHYSDVFFVGNYPWRVFMYPMGNDTDHISMYLQVADWENLQYGWNRCAQFSIAIVNQFDNRNTVRHQSAPELQFNALFTDTGFQLFMPLSALYDPDRGYVVDNTCIVEAEVKVTQDYWNFYDSRKETGYVGLTNQGATCYLNSLLQTLYHIPYFRKAVYNMPTENDSAPGGRIPSALQTLFYNLQYNEDSVATKELTESFGWNRQDSFMQRDVQELNRVLCEKIEDRMKGTVAEGTIQHLFEGHHMNYIECINVDYKSTRKESFYDIQLDVKGCRDVYASFDKYVEVEHLEGNNKYHADQQYGLQDAKKGILFTDFPPVLQLQLKRYEYDVMRESMVKINDRYEFPLQLDLDREAHKYLSPDSDRSVRNRYTLHAVLVHSGGGSGGHYYAFIRPTLSEQWFKFNDERVTKEDTKCALEEQYGGDGRYSNAYMLVYIRESDRDKIICNADVKEIAEPLSLGSTRRTSCKVGLSHPNGELRLLEVFSHKISKILPPSEKIMHINDQYWTATLRAEEILEEEKNLSPKDRLISVCHFTKDANGLKHFGEPFLLAVHEGETLDAVKLRIQKKLQFPDEEFVKWKLAYLSWMGRVEYLQDSDIDPNRFPKSNYGARERYLGLEHSDSSPVRAYVASKNLHIG
ncbi:hypothetical protein C5167_044492 [Papaver somniferum]|uniref:Ubiquitin carboxyl-terminal hydrolase n=1 Tax=Papaver somniferum TaxID=3469 RepID=A0A4Y7L8P9_PAPSO|nr:hypothetical protein C5167_044492 [Papaver somniferum]